MFTLIQINHRRVLDKHLCLMISVSQLVDLNVHEQIKMNQIREYSFISERKRKNLHVQFFCLVRIEDLFFLRTIDCDGRAK